MTIREIFKIDIMVHNRCSLEEKMNFLRVVKNELFQRMLIKGIFDNIDQSYKITFNKIPYDEQEMNYAIDNLAKYYMVIHKCGGYYYALKQAKRYYKDLKPFNLEMIIEVDDDC